MGKSLTMRIIDLHTHQEFDPSIIQIRNIFAQDLSDQELDFPFSTGLHPWDLERPDKEQCLSSMEDFLSNKNMLAIGECGLDRIISTDFAVQLYFFKEQIKIAEKSCKPLIIHCVRAYPDLIQLKKNMKTRIPWIIHGYNGNSETTTALIRHDFYFSVGQHLIADTKKMEVLKQIPPDRLFLETDISDLPIAEVYNKASKVLNIDNEALNQIIYENFTRIFGYID